MVHHHKTNRTVEGNPDTGHGRGLPRRPDDEELEELTDEERRRAGLPPDPEATLTTEEIREDEAAEAERERESGELRGGSDAPRAGRRPFPPSHYDKPAS